MNKKIIVAIVLFLSLAVLVSSFWFVKNYKLDNANELSIIKKNYISENGAVIQKQEEIEKQTELDKKDLKTEDLKIEKIDTGDWKTYTNKERGFEVKYPGRLNCKEEDRKNNNPNVSVEEYFYVFFHPDKEDDQNKFLCGTALYIDVRNLPTENMKLEDLIEAKNEWNGDLLPKYKFNDNTKILLSGKEFIFANAAPYFLSAVTIKNNKYYIIHMGSDIGGSIISKDCEDIYMNFLNSFRFI